jgi:hypothetical protein
VLLGNEAPCYHEVLVGTAGLSLVDARDARGTKVLDLKNPQWSVSPQAWLQICP